MTFPGVGLTAISGGINRLRTKGGADKNSLFDLLNGYVTQAGTVKVREGTYRNANIAAYSGAGTTKGLMAYQNQLHVFSSEVVGVPPNYALHVLNYPANQSESENLVFTTGTFAAATRIGTNTNYGLVSLSAGFAKQAVINPQPLGDVGSVTPTSFLGVAVVAFFQATAASVSDPNEVYLVTNPALPPAATLTYNDNSGMVTVTAGSALTTNLGLAAGYAAYALGTGTPNYDPNAANVGLLLHFDPLTRYNDSSANVLVNTPFGTGTTISTATKEIGAGSASFNGSGGLNYPVTLNGPLDLSAGDWTVEFWLNAGVQGSGEGAIFFINDGGSSFLEVLYNTSTDNIVTIFQSATAAASATNSVPLNTWTAVAIVVHGTNMQIYVNGIASGAAIPITRGAPLTASRVLQVAAGTGVTVPYAGFIDEVRFTKGVARYTANYTPATAPFLSSLTLTYNNSAPFPLKEIHFSAPYLGGIYVVAEFDVTDSVLLAQFGSVFHYWIQSSTGGDNSNEWEANTDYKLGDVVIPTTPNGLTFIASRLLPANPLWQANTVETVGNIVEPTTPNGFKFTATATLGATPTTGSTEPTWPTFDGATVNENSALESDQTVTLAQPASATVAPATPSRYTGLFSPPSGT